MKIAILNGSPRAMDTAAMEKVFAEATGDSSVGGQSINRMLYSK